MRKVLDLNVSVVTIRDNQANLTSALGILGANDVLVGVPAIKAARDAEVDYGNGPINNAALAYIHNFGSPAANIPARPFMEPGIKNVSRQITDLFQRAAEAALEGEPVKVLELLNAAGIVAATGIKAKITSGPFAALAAVTLRLRRKRGRTGTRPLIDTGQLRNSITYVVRKKK